MMDQLLVGHVRWVAQPYDESSVISSLLTLLIHLDSSMFVCLLLGGSE